MQCEGMKRLAEDRVTGGESGDVRVVLTGTEIVFFNLGVEVLAGELEGIAHILLNLCGKSFAEGIECVRILQTARSINDLPDTADPVVQVEVSVCFVVAGVLGDYLAISVNISLHDISAII